MRTFFSILFCFIAFAAANVAGAGEVDLLKKPPKGFTPIFNGKNLDGWKATGNANVWKAENGLLVVSGGGGGWLMTEKEYGDFTLYLEFKMPKMGNSGVALRSPLKGNPAYAGMEIQLIDDDNWKNLRPYQHTGSIYGVVPAKRVITRPHGKWNQMVIVAKGRKVKVYLNGDGENNLLVDADLGDYTEKFGKEHPGLKRRRGHIGLQSYNFRVEFRHIWLRTEK